MQKLSSFFLPRRRDSLDGSWKKIETSKISLPTLHHLLPLARGRKSV
jgi:hypothetical protein